MQIDFIYRVLYILNLHKPYEVFKWQVQSTDVYDYLVAGQFELRQARHLTKAHQLGRGLVTIPVVTKTMRNNKLKNIELAVPTKDREYKLK